ncbi:MAG: glutamyl-tRNA reductase, partial [Methylocella sp.]
LIIGASTMGEMTARSLMEQGAKSIIVANRTFTRAFEIAEKWGIEAVEFEALPRALADADIVITSTGAPHPILHADFLRQVMTTRAEKPLMLIDIAVPRDVEEAAGRIPCVHLFDMDDLRQVADTNMCKRAIEIEKVQVIVDEEAEKFGKWLNALESVPTIVLLRARAESVRKAELERSYRKWKDITPAQRGAIDNLTQRLMNRWLKSPVEFLREKAKEGNGVVYIEALRELFDLDETEALPEDAGPD